MDQPSYIFQALTKPVQHINPLMAGTTAMEVKQLGELLKEQQEPFILETYLSERRCRRRTSVTSSDSSKQQRKTINGDLLVRCPKIFRVVYNKLFRARNSDEFVKSRYACVNENGLHGQENADTDRISSSASTSSATTTVYNSCSEIDTEQDDDQVEKEVDADGGLRWRSTEDTKEHSPVSVLEDITSLGASEFHKKQTQPTEQPITEDSILSASLWNILLKYSATEVEDFVLSSSSSQSFMTKQVLQQNNQLMFDCVRELKEGKHKTCRPFLGSEEIGKLICKRINAWGKQTGDISFTKPFADLEFSQDWRGIEEQKSEIGLVIGDEILEKMVDESVLDMVINRTDM